MGNIVKGDVVVIPFPFSDLTSTRKRPAVVIATLKGDDYILAQITSISRPDEYTITLKLKDFKEGKLPHESIIRSNKLFTADKSLILYKVGSLKIEKLLINIFTL